MGVNLSLILSLSCIYTCQRRTRENCTHNQLEHIFIDVAPNKFCCTQVNGAAGKMHDDEDILMAPDTDADTVKLTHCVVLRSIPQNLSPITVQNLLFANERVKQDPEFLRYVGVAMTSSTNVHKDFSVEEDFAVASSEWRKWLQKLAEVDTEFAVVQ